MRFDFKQLAFRILHLHNFERKESHWREKAELYHGQYHQSFLYGVGMVVHIAGNDCFIGGLPVKSGRLSHLICHIKTFNHPIKNMFFLTTVKSLLLYGTQRPKKTNDETFNKTFNLFCESESIIQSRIDEKFKKILLKLTEVKNMKIEINHCHYLTVNISWFRLDLSPTFDDVYPDIKELITMFTK